MFIRKKRAKWSVDGIVHCKTRRMEYRWDGIESYVIEFYGVFKDISIVNILSVALNLMFSCGSSDILTA
jgi:hypothetical protein